MYLHAYASFGLGSVSGGVCSFGVLVCADGVSVGVVVQAVRSFQCCFTSRVWFCWIHCNLGYCYWLHSLSVFRSIPLFADVALVQAWVGPHIEA